jgi:hypothetical protein
MVPFVESSATSDVAAEPEVDAGRTIEVDPIRRLVHVALVLYLTPVILVVCLIGGVSIMFGKASKIAERLAFRPSQRDKHDHLLVARMDGKEIGPRFRDDRERTHISH